MMAVEAVKEKFYCFLGIVHPTYYQSRGWGPWLGIFTEIMFTVNMPPIKNSPHKTGKSMLFFTFEIPLFSVMSINSQIYMTKPKQAQKTLSENTGKTFSVIMPPFSSKGGA